MEALESPRLCRGRYRFGKSVVVAAPGRVQRGSEYLEVETEKSTLCRNFGTYYPKFSITKKYYSLIYLISKRKIGNFIDYIYEAIKV